MTETTPFEHKVIPRHTDFRMPAEIADLTIQDVYAALVNDPARNALIAADLRSSVETGRSPLLLTGRKEHLEFFAAAVEGCAKHVFVLKGGMGKKQRRMTAEALAAVPETESRVIIATGSYIGEGVALCVIYVHNNSHEIRLCARFDRRPERCGAGGAAYPGRSRKGI
jgi:hypothetical protein